MNTAEEIHYSGFVDTRCKSVIRLYDGTSVRCASPNTHTGLCGNGSIAWKDQPWKRSRKKNQERR